MAYPGYSRLRSGSRRTAFGTLHIPVWGDCSVVLFSNGMSLLHVLYESSPITKSILSSPLYQKHPSAVRWFIHHSENRWSNTFRTYFVTSLLDGAQKKLVGAFSGMSCNRRLSDSTSEIKKQQLYLLIITLSPSPRTPGLHLGCRSSVYISSHLSQIVQTRLHLIVTSDWKGDTSAQ